jgi:tetraacyldisaccharide 4'-kinase
MEGVSASLLRLLLTPLSWLFGIVAELRVSLYRMGVFTRHRVPCPVISVGNLTVGGTGKTPLVEWVVRETRLFGLNAVVLTRGYGAAEDESPDEIETLSENLADLRAIRDPDRVRGALTAIERHQADAVVLDDGFQHVRLARRLDLVTVDATAPFGGGHCLPRGTLREPVRALRRAHAIILTRADLVPAEQRDRILDRIRRIAPRAVVATAVHRPAALVGLSAGEESPLDRLDGRRVYAASGIGNPAAFEATLLGLGAKLSGVARYPDHHRYSPEDLERVKRQADAAGAESIVTTQKDAVKWRRAPKPPPALALVVRIAFTSGEDDVRGLLRGALRV